MGSTDGKSTFAGFLSPLLLLILSVAPVFAQSSAGLQNVSIDCGSLESFVDEVTQITWVPDAGYISTGKNAQNVYVYDDTSINVNQTRSLRYFDEGRGRNCYVLKVKLHVSYLVRATFYYGDWRSPEGSSKFRVYLNSNRWLNFDFDNADDPQAYTFEVLVYMIRDTLDVCLVRLAGSPFISSLELRSLDSGMYLSVVGSRKFLRLARRYNTGALRNSAYLRHPDDKYDRIWSGPEGRSSVNVSTAVNGSVRASPAALKEKPPAKVMEDAWAGNYAWFSSSLSYTSASVGEVATYIYFQDVDGAASSSNPRGMQYFVNDMLIDSFNLTSDAPYEVSSCILGIYDRNKVTINVTKAPWSKLDPILNALEIYLVGDWNGSSTHPKEVESIENIKSLVNFKDWTGDPCVPVPYDWLDCQWARINSTVPSKNNQTFLTTNGDRTALIRSLNLSGTKLATIPALDLSTFQNLTVLDLSSNSFTGAVSAFVENISVTGLRRLKAANNKLQGAFPLGELYDRTRFPNLEEANFDGNNEINGLLDLTSWQEAFKSGNADPNLFPTIYLRNTSITGISPGLDELASDIDGFLLSFEAKADSFNNSGVLLGGSPWCEKVVFRRQPVAQQYLCRSDPDQFLPGFERLSFSKDQPLGAIIGGVAGAFAFVSCLFLAALCWFRRRLKKQASAVEEVTEALARQKVKPPFFSYADLRAATNNFSSTNELGHGAFGSVYKGMLLDSTDGGVEQLLAVKKLFPSKQALTEFLNEVLLITGIKHRNLVQLKGCCIHKDDERMLVYEYAENGNLAEALWDKSLGKDSLITLDWQQRLNICVGIARGLAYLHEELQPRIIHRDIKPPNILLDKSFNAKIADFGTARYLPEPEFEAEDSFTKHVTGTKGYFSPEYATKGQLTEKADVFSFGIVLLEIVSGRRCIDPQLPIEKQFLHDWAVKLRDTGNLLDLLDPAMERTAATNEEASRVINLAFLCLEYFPAKRPTMSEAVSMLQGFMDVTLYKPDSSPRDLGYGQPGDRHSYARLMEQISEAYSTESFLISDSSNDDNTARTELSTF